MDELISKQAAIDALEYSKELCSAALDNLDYNMAKHEFYLEQINDDIDTIKGLPSAQPEPKTGNWIEISKYNDCYLVKCSECGGDQIVMSDFCPNCGSYNGGEAG